MTIPTSGGIGFSTLNAELGRASNSQLGIDDPELNLLRGASSHPITLSQFRGKTRFVMVAGVDSSFPNLLGYDNGSFVSVHGSCTPSADSRYNLAALVQEFDGSNYFTSLVLAGSGPANQFSTLYINGVTLTSSSAVYSSQGATVKWTWFAGVGMVNGGAYSVYIN